MQYRTFPLAVNVNPPPFFYMCHVLFLSTGYLQQQRKCDLPVYERKDKCFCVKRTKTQNIPFWNEQEIYAHGKCKYLWPWGLEGWWLEWGLGKAGTEIDKKKKFFCFSGEKNQGRDSEPVLGNRVWFSFFFSECQYKHLHIQASLQDLSLVPRSVYINPNTSKTLPFRSLVMAKAEIKQYGWIKAATGDLNFTHHWSLCIFDSS